MLKYFQISYFTLKIKNKRLTYIKTHLKLYNPKIQTPFYTCEHKVFSHHLIYSLFSKNESVLPFKGTLCFVLFSSQILFIISKNHNANGRLRRQCISISHIRGCHSPHHSTKSGKHLTPLCLLAPCVSNSWVTWGWYYNADSYSESGLRPESQLF